MIKYIDSYIVVLPYYYTCRQMFTMFSNTHLELPFNIEMWVISSNSPVSLKWAKVKLPAAYTTQTFGITSLLQQETQLCVRRQPNEGWCKLAVSLL